MGPALAHRVSICVHVSRRVLPLFSGASHMCPHHIHVPYVSSSAAATTKASAEVEEEEEESLFKADAVNEEGPERDRATQV